MNPGGGFRKRDLCIIPSILLVGGIFFRSWLIFKEEFFMVKEKMTYRDAEVHDGDRRAEEGDLLGRGD
jgi:hypothetical protein